MKEGHCQEKPESEPRVLSRQRHGGGLVVCVWVCARTDTAVTVNASDSRWHTAAQTTGARSPSCIRKDTPALLSAESRATPLGAKTGQARHQAQNERSRQPAEA